MHLFCRGLNNCRLHITCDEITGSLPPVKHDLNVLPGDLHHSFPPYSAVWNRFASGPDALVYHTHEQSERWCRFFLGSSALLCPGAIWAFSGSQTPTDCQELWGCSRKRPSITCLVFYLFPVWHRKGALSLNPLLTQGSGFLIGTWITQFMCSPFPSSKYFRDEFMTLPACLQEESVPWAKMRNKKK